MAGPEGTPASVCLQYSSWASRRSSVTSSLPQSEVEVQDTHRDQAGSPVLDLGLIGGQDLAEDLPRRRAVADEVVERQPEDAALVVRDEEAGAEQRRVGEVEGPDVLFVHHTGEGAVTVCGRRHGGHSEVDRYGRHGQLQ
jgi:hypothetical protein